MFNYWFSFVVFSLASFVLYFTFGYVLYTLVPVPAVIIVSCVLLRYLTSNIALTVIKEKIEEKK